MTAKMISKGINARDNLLRGIKTVSDTINLLN